MEDPLEILESHKAITAEVNKTMDACVKRLIEDCGYKSKAVIMAVIFASMRGSGRMVTGAPEGVQRPLRDKALAEFYLGLSDPPDEAMGGLLDEMVKSIRKRAEGGL